MENNDGKPLGAACSPLTSREVDDIHDEISNYLRQFPMMGYDGAWRPASDKMLRRDRAQYRLDQIRKRRAICDMEERILLPIVSKSVATAEATNGR